ncbi:MAG: hypothetical protein QF645_12670 [Planctomycetota bacterium]|nr:hypothetical protein [Planctomycetota bacterium]
MNKNKKGMERKITLSTKTLRRLDGAIEKGRGNRAEGPRQMTLLDCNSFLQVGCGVSCMPKVHCAPDFPEV